VAEAEVAIWEQLPFGPSDASAKQTLRLLRDSWRYMSELRQAHGDVFTLRPLRSPPLVVVSDPRLAREVFGGPSTLRAGVANRILEPASGEHSVLFLDGEEHLDRRRLLLRAFRRAQLDAYAPVIEDVVRRELDTWPLDTPIALHPRFRSVSADIMLRVVFGGREGTWCNALKKDLLNIQFQASRQRSRVVLNDIVRSARTAGVESTPGVMGLLIAAKNAEGKPFADEEVVDELLALLVAGEETTAGTLAWAVERLSRNPGIQQRLRNELDGQGATEYMDAVVAEVLRVRPVLQWSVRYLDAPLQLDRWVLPEGVVVAVSIYLLHMRSDLYADPERFDPDRFLAGRHDSPHTWMPFGGGVRRCLGAGLAMLEVTTVLRQVLRRFVLLPPADCDADENWRRRGITFVPAKEATVRLLSCS